MKIDLRCGRIVECSRVPDADSLYLLKAGGTPAFFLGLLQSLFYVPYLISCAQINIGEDQPRQASYGQLVFFAPGDLRCLCITRAFFGALHLRFCHHWCSTTQLMSSRIDRLAPFLKQSDIC